MSAYESLRDLAGDAVQRSNGRRSELICPAHEDRKASLVLSVGEDSNAVVHCHAGCTAQEVMAAWDLTTGALFDSHWEPNGNGKAGPTAIYDYTDENGVPLFQVGRFVGKQFFQRRPRPHDDRDWSGGIQGVRRVLYRLPQVIAAIQAGARIYVVEGEEDVHAIERMGGVATCNPGGAGKWRTEFTELLRGADVVVVQDRDGPGHRHAAPIASDLGVPLVEAKSGKDARDHLGAGHRLDEFVTGDEYVEQSSDWLTGEPMDPCAVPAEPLAPLPGLPFMHRAMTALISGPTGGGRSMVFQACIYDAARAGLRIAYLGSEVTKDEFNARAAKIAEKRGDSAQAVRSEVASARYFDLTDTLTAAWKNPKAWIDGIGERYDLVVIDPLGDALSVAKVGSENSDYVDFYKRLIEPLRNRDTAVVMLDNIGHSEDARLRAIGQSAKGHKADLIFFCTAKKDPLALTITLDKVRTIRTALKKGDTWIVAESDLLAIGTDAPIIKRSVKPSLGEQRRAALLAAVPEDDEMAQDDVIKAASKALGDELKRETARDILTNLELHGHVVKGRDGKRNTWIRASGEVANSLGEPPVRQMGLDVPADPPQCAIDDNYEEG